MMRTHNLLSPRLGLHSISLYNKPLLKVHTTPHVSSKLLQAYCYSTQPKKPSNQLQNSSKHDVNAYIDQSTITKEDSKGSFLNKFKEMFIFYKTGMKAVFSNRIKAREFETKEKEGTVLTRREQRFIVTSRKDFNKLGPFGLLVLILPESIPFLVVFAPQFIPTTCVTEEQLLKKRKKLQERRDNVTQIAMRSTQKSDLLTMDGFSSVDRLLNTIRTYHESFSYDLIKSKPLRAYCKFMGISTWAPGFILVRRMQAHFRFLRKDDQLILSEGLQTLTHEELIEANEERGMRTLGQSDAQLRQALKDWIAVSLSESPSPPDLLLVVSRVFINNVRTKV